MNLRRGRLAMAFSRSSISASRLAMAKLLATRVAAVGTGAGGGVWATACVFGGGLFCSASRGIFFGTTFSILLSGLIFALGGAAGDAGVSAASLWTSVDADGGGGVGGAALPADGLMAGAGAAAAGGSGPKAAGSTA